MVLETIPTDEFPDAGDAIYAPTPEDTATFQTARAVMKDWFVQNIEDGQVRYDKLDAAVKEAETRVDAARAVVARSYRQDVAGSPCAAPAAV